MKCAAYVRVSSRQQDLTLQRRAIAKAAEARGDTIAQACWYSEKRSGSGLNRPELDRLRADVRAGEIRKVYVFRIDRLTRKGIRDTLAIVEELRSNGCQLATVADGFSLEGPAADVVLAVLAWAAQMERAALGERISAARDRIEAEGGTWGRPSAIAPVTLERARKLKSEGRTVREIAVALKVKRSTLHGALSEKGHYAKKRLAAKKSRSAGAV
jgi:DNA invertase Pin-like site-specific DNA recombinase